MPTCGKSTIGVVLAKMLGLDFVDTDILIQNKYGAKLNKLIEDNGLKGFLDIEESVISSVKLSDTVIATGGSAVYSSKAMTHLKDIAKVVYLKVPLADIARRMTDLRERGVVIEEGKTIKDLYFEREPLYKKYADYVVSEQDKSLEQTVEELVKLFY